MPTSPHRSPVLSLRGAKRRGNPFSPAQRNGFPRQRQGHWLGMTARRCRADGTSGTPSPTGSSPSSSVGRDPCVPPRFARCLRRGDVSIAPYGIARVSCNVGRRGRRPLRNDEGRTASSAPTKYLLPQPIRFRPAMRAGDQSHGRKQHHQR